MRFEKQLNAYAKINLFLYMSGYRDDGYHLLYSLMQSVELSDVVRISVSENESSDANVLSYSLSGLLINDTGRNSVMDAIELYMNAVSENGYKVHANIDKRIPDRAGLGGGSADAAAALTLINEAFSNRLSQKSLAELGLAVGADVPFALRGGAVLCRGVGEIMNDVPPFSGLHILLIKPDIGISTVQAYQAFDRIRGNRCVNLREHLMMLILLMIFQRMSYCVSITKRRLGAMISSRSHLIRSRSCPTLSRFS